MEQTSTARARQAEGGQVLFWCPGCDQAHAIRHDGSNAWLWNGDLEHPTFTPSVLVTAIQWPKGTGPTSVGERRRAMHPSVEEGSQTVCHSFVSDGRIRYLADSTHALAGQTVDVPPWPYTEDGSHNENDCS